MSGIVLVRWLRRLALLASAAVAVSQLRPAHAEVSTSAQAGWHYEGNPGHAADEASLSSDQRADATLHLDARAYPSDFDTLALSGELELAHYARHPGLDHVAFDKHLSLFHSTGLGYRRPWWRAEAGAAHSWYRDGVRDGWRFTAALGAGVRLDARWDVAAGLQAERRTQDHAVPDGPDLPGTVFAQGRQGVRLDTRWVATPDWTLQLAGWWLRGDFDAVHQQDLDNYAGVAAYADDPTFGPDGYGYRFRAVSRTVELLASRALGPHSSLNLVYSRTATVAAQGTRYVDPEVSLVYAWRS